MTTRKACIVLFVLVNIVIFYFSAQSGEVSNAVSDSFSHAVKVEKVAPLFNTPSWELWHLKLALRKYAHVFLFGLLGVFGFLAWNPNKRLALRITWTVIICYAMACFDELHQVLVPGRTASFDDTFIDLVGTAVGIGIGLVIGFQKQRKAKKEANRTI